MVALLQWQQLTRYRKALEGGSCSLAIFMSVSRSSAAPVSKVVARLCLTVVSKFVALAYVSACAVPPQTDGASISSVPQSEEAANVVLNTPSMPNVPSHQITFDTTEGTFMSIDVSPDGESIVFDMLGDIYSLSIAGGDAVPVTSGRAWDQTPRFSPDGRHVYFVSDRKGYKNIWRVALADNSLQQVTRADSDVRGGPNWSHDGSHLLAGVGDAETRNSEVALQSIDPISGSMTAIEQHDGPWIDMDTFEPFRQRNMTYSGVQTANGQVYFSEAQYGGILSGSKTVRMYTIDSGTQTRRTLTPEDASYSEFKPQLSHNGNLLAYFRQYSDRRTEIRILNRTTGQDEPLIALANADDPQYTFDDDSRPNYDFTPDDRYVVFWHGGKIHRVSLADGSSEIVPFRVKVSREVSPRIEPVAKRISDDGSATAIRWPSASRDGQTMAFVAFAYVWVMDMATGDIQRLTESTDFEYMPALSPDGNSVAFISFAQTHDEYGPGRLVLANIDDGSSRELLAIESGAYLIPKWSQDGSKIALIKEIENDGIREATFGWTPAVGGVFHDVAEAPTSIGFASWPVYARYVGFDDAGERLLFSYPIGRSGAVLVMAGLDGNSSQTLAASGAEVGGITPAPDLKNLALTRDDGTVWLIPFAIGEEPPVVSTMARNARRIGVGGGYFVDWNRKNKFTYGFGQYVYRYDLDLSALESFPVDVSTAMPRAAQPIAFVGAKIVTLANAEGIGPVIESGTILLENQRIVAVGSVGDVPIPLNAFVIDATGKTIIPGLLDTHYHRIGGRGNVMSVSAFKLPIPNFSDRSAISYGITTAWEPGAAVNDGVPATADLQRSGRIMGPRWSHSASGGVGSPYEFLTTYAAALAAVKQHLNLGAAVLKEYLAPTRQQRQWLSTAARANGAGIVSHLETFEGMMTRIVDGYTGGDHPFVPMPFFKDVHEMLRQSGFIWTPNIVITVGVQGSGQDKFCRAFSEWKQRISSSDEFGESICVVDGQEPTTSYETHRISRVAEQVASAAGNGVHVGVSGHNMPASNLHREMWFLWKGGMPIEDVLRAATIGNAEKLGLQDEIGSLEIGKIADFLVLNENPLNDILNTLSLKYTVQGGVVYNSDTALPVHLNSLRETDIAVVQ